MYYNKKIEDIFDELKTDIDGLNDKEVDGKRKPAKLTSLSYKNGNIKM